MKPEDMSDADFAVLKTALSEMGSNLSLLDSELRTRLKDLEAAVVKGMRPDALGTGAGGPSIGELLAKSEALANFDPHNSNGRARVELGEIIAKALTSATAVPDKNIMPGIVPVAPAMTSFLFVRLAAGRMSGGVLEYVIDESDYNAGNWNPNTPPTSEGNTKPEVSQAFALKTLTPKTIAHWQKASKQILADAAGLHSFVDGRMLFGLMRKLEWQCVMGDGLNGNMTGVYTSASAHPDPAADVSPIDTIREAIGIVEAEGFVVDTLGINPIDYASFQIEKGTDGHYVLGNPATTGTGARPLWGKFTVPSFAVPQGEFIVGDFARGAQLFEREGAAVQVGYDGNDFTKNLVTILAELRANLANYAPTTAFRRGKLVTVAP